MRTGRGRCAHWGLGHQNVHASLPATMGCLCIQHPPPTPTSPNAPPCSRVQHKHLWRGTAQGAQSKESGRCAVRHDPAVPRVLAVLLTRWRFGCEYGRRWGSGFGRGTWSGSRCLLQTIQWQMLWQMERQRQVERQWLRSRQRRRWRERVVSTESPTMTLHGRQAHQHNRAARHRPREHRDGTQTRTTLHVGCFRKQRRPVHCEIMTRT